MILFIFLVYFNKLYASIFFVTVKKNKKHLKYKTSPGRKENLLVLSEYSYEETVRLGYLVCNQCVGEGSFSMLVRLKSGKLKKRVSTNQTRFDLGSKSNHRKKAM